MSREMAQRYLSFDIKSFVDSNPHIRWCPLPGCGQAVSRVPSEEGEVVEATRSAEPLARPGHTVSCGNGHYFCW